MKITAGELDQFKHFYNENLKYWSIEDKYLEKRTENIALIDLLHNRPDVLIRSLTVGKFVQKYFGCKLVGLIGQTDFSRIIFDGCNPTYAGMLAKSYGVDDLIVVETPEQSDFPIRAGSADQFFEFDVFNFSEAIEGCSEDDAKRRILQWCAPNGVRVGEYIFDTCQRISFSPQFPVYKANLERTIRETLYLQNIFENVVTKLDVGYFVTSHIFYNTWGLLSEVALRQNAEVFYISLDTNLSIFRLQEPPNSPDTLGSLCRKAETSIFENYIWPNCSKFHTITDKAIDFLNTGEMLYPSWWTRDVLDLASQAGNRDALLARLGWDSAKPVYAVLNHAMTDAVRFDTPLFSDCYAWLDYTLSHASRDDSKNWLVKMHPHDKMYDRTATFEKFEAQYGSLPHIRFVRDEFTKSELFTLMQAAITIRGSLGFEVAAAGIPSVLAGRSRISEIGFGRVAHSLEHYKALLETPLADIALDDEQVERARLYVMYNRLIGPVFSNLILNVALTAESDIWIEMRKLQRTTCVDIDNFYRNFARCLDGQLPRIVNLEFLQMYLDANEVEQDKSVPASATG